MRSKQNNYNSEGLRELQNKVYYEEIIHTETENIAKTVYKMIEHWHISKQIDDITCI